MEKFKFIDLFAGIGGFHQAMTSLGGECVFAADIDDDAVKVYKENYNMDPSGCAASRQGRILRVQKDPGDDGDAGVLYHGACDGGGRTQRLCCRRG